MVIGYTLVNMGKMVVMVMVMVLNVSLSCATIAFIFSSKNT